VNREFFQSLNPASLRADAGKFEAKLSFAERCAILACLVNGTNPKLLAFAFGINRRTVTHIVNPKSVHYKSVRAELVGLGTEAFTDKYVTEEIRTRIAEAEGNALATIVTKMNNDTVEKHAINIRTPTKNRNKDAGFHVVHPEQCEHSHRVEIQWTLSHLGEGWYYRDLDGSRPSEWMNAGEESILTSTAALKGAESEVTDA
jgi:hypothetical protein